MRGRVRIRSFTAEPEGVAAYGPVADETGGREFRLTVEGRARGMAVARIAGIEDRGAAEALRGTRLYVARDRLPEPEDGEEFYHADLLGMAAEGPDGAMLGTVRAVIPAGEADVLEIAARGAPPLLVPFTREAVPVVDLRRRRLSVVPPDGESGR